MDAGKEHDGSDVQEIPDIWDDSLYCPLNYVPCKWSGADEVQCIPREHLPCTNTRDEYRERRLKEDTVSGQITQNRLKRNKLKAILGLHPEWRSWRSGPVRRSDKNKAKYQRYNDGEISLCRSPAQWNETKAVQGLSCKFDEDKKTLAYLTEQPVLSRQISEMADRPGWIIPRFTIDAHGSVRVGTTTIPPNTSLTTWGAWGKLQWNFISDKIGNLLSTKKEKITAEDIQNIYKDISKTYQCSRNTFPPTWKDSNYELGGKGNRVVPYNKDCYKITLSSRGSSVPQDNDNDKATIKDTTMKQDGDIQVIWRDGLMRKQPVSDEKIDIDSYKIPPPNDNNIAGWGYLDPDLGWKCEDLTKVLMWIYQYSIEKYGNFGTDCKLDRENNKRKVGRIRITLQSCLRYNPSCIIGSCESRTLDKDVSYEQITRDLDERKKKLLYRAPIHHDPVENMAHWRIDALSHFPYAKITPYDAYFENLENWVITETNQKSLIHVYEILTKQIYKTLFLEAIMESNSPAHRGRGALLTPLKRGIINNELGKYLGDFIKLLRSYYISFVSWQPRRLRSRQGSDFCNICQTFPEMFLNYSVCQEFLIKTEIFVKLIKLNPDVEDKLINLEKECLKSWIYLVIEQLTPFSSRDEDEDRKEDSIDPQDDPEVQGHDPSSFLRQYYAHKPWPDLVQLQTDLQDLLNSSGYRWLVPATIEAIEKQFLKVKAIKKKEREKYFNELAIKKREREKYFNALGKYMSIAITAFWGQRSYPSKWKEAIDQILPTGAAQIVSKNYGRMVGYEGDGPLVFHLLPPLVRSLNFDLRSDKQGINKLHELYQSAEKILKDNGKNLKK